MTNEKKNPGVLKILMIMFGVIFCIGFIIDKLFPLKNEITQESQITEHAKLPNEIKASIDEKEIILNSQFFWNMTKANIINKKG